MNESSINSLYKSAVKAFPLTTKRQYAIDPIEIKEVSLTPYIGMKTLFVKALAINEDRKYNPIILFKNVLYGKGKKIIGSDGLPYQISTLSLDETEVLLRCPCKDFHWRFNFFDHLDHSLYGRKRSKYEAKYNPGSANPLELPGMCKHLMALTRNLKNSGIIEY